MNENLQQALERLITKSLDGIDSATGFLEAEIPEYVEQLMNWYMVKGAFLSFVCLFVLIGSLYMIYNVIFKERTEDKERLDELSSQRESGETWTKFRGFGMVTSIEYDREVRKAKNGGYSDEAQAILGGVFSSSAVISAICILPSMSWVQIWIAPKVWLVEYAANLVK